MQHGFGPRVQYRFNLLPLQRPKHGTRSPQGTDTPLRLCALVGTWRAPRGHPYLPGRQRLARPQV